MKTMKYPSALLLLFLWSSAYACTCGRSPAPEDPHYKEEFSYYDAIFVGSVEKKVENSEDGPIWAIKVEQQWKGDLPETINYSLLSMCTIIPVVGREYLFFANQKTDGTYMATECSNSGLKEQRKDHIEKLNTLD